MHGLGKTFGWSLHLSFRNTQIAVVVVAGVGMVTSLPPAAPATPWLMLPCSIAGSSHGAPSCHTSPSGMSPALDPGSQPTKSPFLSLPLQGEWTTPRLSSGKGRSELSVRALPNSTSELLCQENSKMAAKGAELPSPSYQLCTTLWMKCQQHGRKAKGPNQIRFPSAIICHLPVTASSSQGEKESCSRKTKAKQACGLHVRKRTKRLQWPPKVWVSATKAGQVLPRTRSQLNANLSPFEQKADGNQPGQGCLAAPGDGLSLWGAGSCRFPSCEDKALPVTTAPCQDCIPHGFVLAGRHIPAGAAARQGQCRAGLQ